MSKITNKQTQQIETQKNIFEQIQSEGSIVSALNLSLPSTILQNKSSGEVCCLFKTLIRVFYAFYLATGNKKTSEKVRKTIPNILSAAQLHIPPWMIDATMTILSSEFFLAPLSYFLMISRHWVEITNESLRINIKKKLQEIQQLSRQIDNSTEIRVNIDLANYRMYILKDDKKYYLDNWDDAKKAFPKYNALFQQIEKTIEFYKLNQQISNTLGSGNLEYLAPLLQTFAPKIKLVNIDKIGKTLELLDFMSEDLYNMPADKYLQKIQETLDKSSWQEVIANGNKAPWLDEMLDKITQFGFITDRQYEILKLLFSGKLHLQQIVAVFNKEFFDAFKTLLSVIDTVINIFESIWDTGTVNMNNLFTQLLITFFITIMETQILMGTDLVINQLEKMFDIKEDDLVTPELQKFATLLGCNSSDKLVEIINGLFSEGVSELVNIFYIRPNNIRDNVEKEGAAHQLAMTIQVNSLIAYNAQVEYLDDITSEELQKQIVDSYKEIDTKFKQGKWQEIFIKFTTLFISSVAIKKQALQKMGFLVAYTLYIEATIKFYNEYKITKTTFDATIEESRQILQNLLMPENEAHLKQKLLAKITTNINQANKKQLVNYLNETLNFVRGQQFGHLNKMLNGVSAALQKLLQFRKESIDPECNCEGYSLSQTTLKLQLLTGIIRYSGLNIITRLQLRSSIEILLQSTQSLLISNIAMQFLQMTPSPKDVDCIAEAMKLKEIDPNATSSDVFKTYNECMKNKTPITASTDIISYWISKAVNYIALTAKSTIQLIAYTNLWITNILALARTCFGMDIKSQGSGWKWKTDAVGTLEELEKLYKTVKTTIIKASEDISKFLISINQNKELVLNLENNLMSIGVLNFIQKEDHIIVRFLPKTNINIFRLRNDNTLEIVEKNTLTIYDGGNQIDRFIFVAYSSKVGKLNNVLQIIQLNLEWNSTSEPKKPENINVTTKIKVKVLGQWQNAVLNQTEFDVYENGQNKKYTRLLIETQKIGMGKFTFPKFDTTIIIQKGE